MLGTVYGDAHITGATLPGSTITLTGGATTDAVLADAVDTSYIENGGAYASVQFYVRNPWIGGAPGLNYTRSQVIATAMQVVVRRSQNGGVASAFGQWFVESVFGLTTRPADGIVYTNVAGGLATQPLPSIAGAINDSVSSWVWQFNGNNGLVPLNLMDFDNLVVQLTCLPILGASTNRVYRVGVNWLHWVVPALSAMTPSGTVTTSKPSVGWTYTDPDDSGLLVPNDSAPGRDPQVAARLIVVEKGAASTKTPFGAAGLTPGFDPTGVVNPAYDSGRLATPNKTIAIGRGLENGKTYDAYVRAEGNPREGFDQFSPWTNSEFTVSVTPPAAPTFVATLDNPNGRVTFAVSESTTATPHPQAWDIERSLDSGATWAKVRGADYSGVATEWVASTTAGNNWTTPDAALFDWQTAPRNNLIVRAKVKLPDYTPAANMIIVQHGSESGTNRAWRVLLKTNGFLEIQVSADGSTYARVATSSASVNSMGYADGAVVWLEWAATGMTNLTAGVQFRTSPDGITWTTIGSPGTGSAGDWRPRQEANQTMRVNGDSAGANGITGSVYEAYVFNSVTPPFAGAIAAPKFAGLPAGATSFTDAAGNVWSAASTGASYLRSTLVVDDRELPYGVAAQYRARGWRKDTETSASDWTYQGVPTGYTITPDRFRLRNPLDSTMDQVVKMVDFSVSRPRPADVIDGPEAESAAVVSGGRRSARIDMTIRTDTLAAWTALQTLLDANATLLIQGPHTHQWYVRLLDDEENQMRSAPAAGEGFPLAHRYLHRVRAVEVAVP